nr:hypothetical protein [Streptomyces antibioticus]
MGALTPERVGAGSACCSPDAEPARRIVEEEQARLGMTEGERTAPG